MNRFLPLAALVLAACATAPVAPPLPPDVEAMSLLGKPLARPRYPANVVAEREKQLEDALAALAKDPGSADALIWVGRRQAYLGRFREAIDTFSTGVKKFPKDARFLRHRGHRYITVREFDRAIADFEKAARLVRGKPDEVEPDGQPNARNIPIGSLQSNICYHHGLAHYLKGEFEQALPIYRRCAGEATNPDRLVSVSHWLYMTLRRLGRPQEAALILEPINAGLDVIENVAYHKLLLMYRGEIAPEELGGETMDGNDRPTIMYGLGNWRLYNGEPAVAREMFERIVASDPWAAFAYIAAEAELARE